MLESFSIPYRAIVCSQRSQAFLQRYEAHFISKLSDCDGENAETDSCLDFALDCSYLTPAEHKELTTLSSEVGKLLGSMILHPEKWILCHN